MQRRDKRGKKRVAEKDGAELTHPVGPRVPDRPPADPGPHIPDSPWATCP